MDLILEIFKEPIINFWNNYISTIFNNKLILQILCIAYTLIIIASIHHRNQLATWYYKKYVDPTLPYVLDNTKKIKWERLVTKIQNEYPIYTGDLDIISSDNLSDLFQASPSKKPQIIELVKLLEDSLIHAGEDVAGDDYYEFDRSKRVRACRLIESINL